MISKVPVFVFTIVTFQIVSSYGDAGVDNSLKNVCDAPALAGKGTERVRMIDVPKQTDAFLSKSVKSLPAICMGNNVSYRFEAEEPSEDDKVMQAAREAIGETSPKAVEAAKAKLVDALKKNPSLNAPIDNDDWLVRVLRLKKYNVPATIEFIKNYYNFKAQNAKLLDGVTPSKLLSVIDSNMFTVSPKRDQNGRRIAIFTTRNFDPKKHTASDLFKMNVVLSELAPYEPATQIAGTHIIVDASGLTMAQVKVATPAWVKKIINYVRFAAPYRYDKIHIVKSSRAFTTLWAMVSPFMPTEMKNKIYIHGNNMKSLHKHITPSALPKDFEGSLPTPTFSSAEWNTLLKTFDEEYAKINTYGLKKN